MSNKPKFKVNDMVVNMDGITGTVTNVTCYDGSEYGDNLPNSYSYDVVMENGKTLTYDEDGLLFYKRNKSLLINSEFRREQSKETSEGKVKEY